MFDVLLGIYLQKAIVQHLFFKQTLHILIHQQRQNAHELVIEKSASCNSCRIGAFNFLLHIRSLFNSYATDLLYQPPALPLFSLMYEDLVVTYWCTIWKQLSDPFPKSRPTIFPFSSFLQELSSVDWYLPFLFLIY